MDARERRFARQEDERARFLQRDIGGAQQQVVAVARDDPGERLHAARRDDHAGGRKCPARDGRAEVVRVIADVREGACLVRCAPRLAPHRLRRAVRHDEMRLDIRHAAQDFEQPHAHLRAARARDADDDAAFLFLIKSASHALLHGRRFFLRLHQRFSIIIAPTLSYTFFAWSRMNFGAAFTV